MKIKRETWIKILIVTFIIQIFISLILKFYSFQEVKLRKISKSLLGDFDSTLIEKIYIEKDNNLLTIEKINSKWFIEREGVKIPAESVKVEAFLDIIRNLPQGIIRDKGEDERNYELFGLDNKNVKKVTLKSKKREYQLYVGDPGVLRGTSYIKINKEKIVREVKSVISHETFTDISYWMRKRIFDDSLISALDVESFIFESKVNYLKSFSIIYEEKKDVYGNLIKDNFKLVPALVKDIKDYELVIKINKLLNLTVIDYKITSLNNENEKIAEMELTLRNGKKYKCNLYTAEKESNADYVMDVDFNDYLYYIKKSDVEKFIFK